MDVFVAGGTGFVGRSLCRVLLDRGHAVTAASRQPNPSVLPDGVTTTATDVTGSSLTEAVAGHDAVVNLVALPSHRTPAAGSHDAVHGDGTRNLLAAAESAGVDRFVQLSGLGVETDLDTAYMRAKRRAEALVRDADVPWVIYRPSVIFGDECAFLSFLRSITPPVVTALPEGGRLRLQPIWVEDLTPMLADGLSDDRHVGETYAIGGPAVLTLAEIVRLTCAVRFVVPVPPSVAMAAARLGEVLPFVPIGRDQVRVFAEDNVTGDDNDVTAFGIDPSRMCTLREYLDGH